MTTTGIVAPVLRTVTVEVPQQHAFTVFTERFDAWWPRSHHTGEAELAEALIEPREGGRWFERGVDGSEQTWGYVITWSPPERVLLAWQLDADWEYDPQLVTEVEVRFVAETAHRTRVELEHRHLDRFGARSAEVRDAIGGDQGWGSLLVAYAAAVA